MQSSLREGFFETSDSDIPIIFDTNIGVLSFIVNFETNFVLHQSLELLVLYT